MEDKLIVALISFLVSVATGLILYEVQPRMRRGGLTKKLAIRDVNRHGVHANLSVYNGGYFTIGNAVAYLTVESSPSDILDSPFKDVATFINPAAPLELREMPLCWSIRAPVRNPMKTDIYAKEATALSPFAIHPQCIEIPSEEGWYHEKGKTRAARVFLRRKKYKGLLKLVSNDTNARVFRIELDPDATIPLIVMPL